MNVPRLISLASFGFPFSAHFPEGSLPGLPRQPTCAAILVDSFQLLGYFAALTTGTLGGRELGGRWLKTTQDCRNRDMGRIWEEGKEVRAHVNACVFRRTMDEISQACEWIQLYSVSTEMSGCPQDGEPPSKCFSAPETPQLPVFQRESHWGGQAVSPCPFPQCLLQCSLKGENLLVLESDSNSGSLKDGVT